MQEDLAFILAGGRVDELKKLTKFRPKSAVPFGGMYRIIDFPLSNMMHSHISTVGLLAQYRSSPLINHILDGRSWDLWGRNRSLTLLPPFKGDTYSDWYNGTIDAVQQNINFVRAAGPKRVLIVSGDHIYKMNYREIIRYHTRKKANLTVGFIKIDPAYSNRFGVAQIDDEDSGTGGKIIRYLEKPKTERFDWASLTIYVFETEFLLRCLAMMKPLAKNQETIEFGRDLITTLTEASGKYRLFGYKYEGYWGYTRTIPEFWHSNMNLLNNRRQIDPEKWQIRTNLDHRGIRDRVPAMIKFGSLVKNSLVCSGCVIEGEVVNSVLSPGVRVAKGAKVYNSIVMFDTKLGENTFLNNVILDVDIRVAPGVTLGNQTDLAANPAELQVFGEGELIG
ncbi:MAG TPA: glucose-1-phosphate adenylyltransferase [Bacteroidetes bacterium]|nr:glucose-1-phosphate adenylyltransferase [Bacteroidota bacterium]